MNSVPMCIHLNYKISGEMLLLSLSVEIWVAEYFWAYSLLYQGSGKTSLATAVANYFEEHDAILAHMYGF